MTEPPAAKREDSLARIDAALAGWEYGMDAAVWQPGPVCPDPHLDYEMAELPCGCQDILFADGCIDREHDHVACDGYSHCACGNALTPCPRCGEPLCLQCTDWRRHHTMRGWLERTWWHYWSQVQPWQR
jgi:hypothetical protein